MFCRKCGQRIKDNEGSCPHCGTKAASAYYPKYSTEIYYCRACGKEADKEDNFCRKCGSALDFSGIIADGIRRRIEKKRPSVATWEYIPKYPAKSEDESEENSESAPLPLNGETAPEGETDFREEVPAPPERKEEVPVQAEEENGEAESSDLEQIISEEIASLIGEPAEETYGRGFFNEQTTEKQPYTDAEKSSNPDFSVTAPAENGNFGAASIGGEEIAETKGSPEEQKNDEFINYSTDSAVETTEKLGINPAVIVTKPRPVKERRAFGIVAVIFSALFPPMGIILGIISVSKGWNGRNALYARLGTTAIIIGVAMTVLMSLLAWKVIIPSIEDYIKSRQTLFLTLKNL